MLSLPFSHAAGECAFSQMALIKEQAEKQNAGKISWEHHESPSPHAKEQDMLPQMQAVSKDAIIVHR
jgi:hypothetical protein